MADVLLVGESEVLVEVRHKGFDSIHMTSRMSDAEGFINALADHGHSITWIDSEHAAASFPLRIEELQRHQVVILSDVGANTLLLTREVHHGIPQPNRLELIKDWVFDGGGLLMCGGWMSFSGMHGAAHYHRTAIEQALPVRIHPYDDRVEVPQGVVASLREPGHEVLRGVAPEWSPLLGYNLVEPKPGATVVAEAAPGDPLLVLGEYGRGRSAAWTSDITLHWASQGFIASPSYGRLFGNIVNWLAG